MKHIILILSFLYAFTCFAQEKDNPTRDYDDHSKMYGNVYTLFKEKKNDKEGKFEHRIAPDNVQVWYGKGSFREYRHKIVLHYNFIESSNRVESINTGAHKDTLYFYWVTPPDNDTLPFTLKYTDPKAQKTYLPDSASKVVKLPFKGLGGNRLTAWHGDQRIIDLLVPDCCVNTVFIRADLRKENKQFNKSKEILRKTRNGIKAKGGLFKNRNLFIRVDQKIVPHEEKKKHKKPKEH